MFTVTHFIQAAITLSTCFELYSNLRTLNPLPYPMQHSNLALSTINLTAAHKFTAVTHNKLFPFCCCYNLPVPKISCWLTFKIPWTRNRRICVIISYQYPFNYDLFVLWDFTDCWSNFVEGLRILATTLLFPQVVVSFHTVFITFLFRCFCEMRLLATSRLCSCLSDSLHCTTGLPRGRYSLN